MNDVAAALPPRELRRKSERASMLRMHMRSYGLKKASKSLTVQYHVHSVILLTAVSI